VAGGLVALVYQTGDKPANAQAPGRPRDAVADAQTPRDVPVERPEQRKSAHDQSNLFAPGQAPQSSEVLAGQGRAQGPTIRTEATPEPPECYPVVV